jgi:hypothetical protein
MFRICFTFLALSSIVPPLHAVPADPSSSVASDPSTLAVPSREQARCRELVQQMGSEQFTEREQAQQALAKMGRVARQALLEGLTRDPNPEIRTRCAALLPRADALDLKARLEVFLADVDGKYEHDLPGWNQFRATVSNEWKLLGYPVWSDRTLEKAARGVFVELIATPINKNLVMATAGPAGELSAIAIGRRQELVIDRMGRGPGGFGGNRMNVAVEGRVPTPDDIAALLFAESLAPQSTARVPRQVSIGPLVMSERFAAILRENDDKGRVYRAIVVAWLESRVNPIDLYQGMSVANQLDMTDQAVRMAARLFTTPGTPVQYRSSAALSLGRLGAKEHIPLLEKAFDDTGVMTTPGRGFGGNVGVPGGREIQVRDVALAFSIQWAGQSPEDYGFIDQVKSGAGATYSYLRFYLPEDKRDAAFDQWKEWWSKNQGK